MVTACARPLSQILRRQNLLFTMTPTTTTTTTTTTTMRTFARGATPNIVVGAPTEKKTCSSSKPGFFSQMWNKYSIKGQTMRIQRAERLFRAAQRRAMDPTWYTKGRIPHTFRPYQAILTMHIWFLHKRLIHNNASSSQSNNDLLIQEELFDIFWHDTLLRIRSENINELLVNKNLKDVQQVTLQHCVHYDHAMTFDDPVRRREEVALAVWTHVLLQSEEGECCCDDLINRLALYVEWQYDNIVHRLPEKYWEEGRVAWGEMMNFDNMHDNEGRRWEDVEVERELMEGWLEALTESGERYWWNEKTLESTWEKPVEKKGVMGV